jgi:hypothetical protein
MVCVLVFPEVCLVSIVQMINEGRGLQNPHADLQVWL